MPRAYFFDLYRRHRLLGRVPHRKLRWRSVCLEDWKPELGLSRLRSILGPCEHFQGLTNRWIRLLRVGPDRSCRIRRAPHFWLGITKRWSRRKSCISARLWGCRFSLARVPYFSPCRDQAQMNLKKILGPTARKCWVPSRKWNHLCRGISNVSRRKRLG